MKLNYEKFLIAQAKSGKTLKELGINTSTLYSLKQGGNIRPKTLKKMADTLEVDPEYLIVKEGEKNG